MLSNLFSYDHGTILLYCFIVLFSTLLARISKKRIIYNADGEMIRTYDKHCFFSASFSLPFSPRQMEWAQISLRTHISSRQAHLIGF